MTSIHFPRASIEDTKLHVSPPHWPPKLHGLYISGGLHDTSLPYFTSLPPSLKSLTIDRCTNLPVGFIRSLLETVGGQLEYLKIGWHMPKVHPGSLDDILSLVPNVSELSIAMDFLNVGFYFDQPTSHPVECITFDSSPYRVHNDYKFNLGDFLFEAASNGRLPSLRTVRISKRVLVGDCTGLERDLKSLGQLLEALESEEKEGRGDHEGKGGKAGVWILE